MDGWDILARMGIDIDVLRRAAADGRIAAMQAQADRMWREVQLEDIAAAEMRARGDFFGAAAIDQGRCTLDFVRGRLDEARRDTIDSGNEPHLKENQMDSKVDEVGSDESYKKLVEYQILWHLEKVITKIDQLHEKIKYLEDCVKSQEEKVLQAVAAVSSHDDDCTKQLVDAISEHDKASDERAKKIIAVVSEKASS
jgi:ASC-1-like (ASCH) protein